MSSKSRGSKRQRAKDQSDEDIRNEIHRRANRDVEEDTPGDDEELRKQAKKLNQESEEETLDKADKRSGRKGDVEMRDESRTPNNNNQCEMLVDQREQKDEFQEYLNEWISDQRNKELVGSINANLLKVYEKVTQDVYRFF